MPMIQLVISATAHILKLQVTSSRQAGFAFAKCDLLHMARKADRIERIISDIETPFQNAQADWSSECTAIHFQPVKTGIPSPICSC